jgi:hypothetical protein
MKVQQGLEMRLNGDKKVDFTARINHIISLFIK